MHYIYNAKFMYFHWFCACHVRILLVLEGLVTNNALYCKVADCKYAYFQWFWEGWIPADLQKQWFWSSCKAKCFTLLPKIIGVLPLAFEQVRDGESREG